MKAKLAIFIVSIYTIIFCVSCNSVLDTQPLTSYTQEEVWSTYSLSTDFLFNCYNNIISTYMVGVYEDDLAKDVVETNWAGWLRSYINEKTEVINATSTDEGWDNFSNIRSVNQILKNVPNSSFTDDQKNTLMGEAYFLKSIIYFWEVKHFGGVQIVKDVLSPDSDLLIPRSSIKDTYDFIISDLNNAISLLPQDNDRGRANKAAGYAFLMRVALQAGATLGSDAATYYNMVIVAGNSLFANYTNYTLDTYGNLFNHYSSAVSSPENILIYEKLAINTLMQDTPLQRWTPNVEGYSKLQTWSSDHFPLVESFEGWPLGSASQDLVDDYLVTDQDGKVKQWQNTSYMNNNTSVYNKMYINRDDRFNASVFCDSSQCFNNLVFTRDSGNVVAQYINATGQGIYTAYITKKYLYQDQGKEWCTTPVNFCYSVLRLGEAYLNYAEAEYMLGNTTLALEYTNKTFQYHGGFSVSVTDVDGSTDLWTAYCRERHVEMALENGDRYWSLLRWGMQKMGGLNEDGSYVTKGYVIPELNSQAHNMLISSDGLRWKVVEATDGGGQEVLKFTPKRYLFPVPYNQVNLGNLKQNPGW